MNACAHNTVTDPGMLDKVHQTVELPTKRQRRWYPMEWERSLVEQTFEPDASVARVARENNINANQLWAWCKRYAQGLSAEAVQTDAMLPVVVKVQPFRSAVHAQVSKEAPTPTAATNGSIRLQHGITSVRIEGVPDSTMLRLVLKRILR